MCFTDERTTFDYVGHGMLCKVLRKMWRNMAKQIALKINKRIRQASLFIQSEC